MVLTLTQQKKLKKEKGRIHLNRRGAGAWSRSHSEPLARVRQQVNRLQVHAVTDEVGLNHYVPACRKFLNWIRDIQEQEQTVVPLHNAEAIDFALADYLAWMCYEEEKGMSTALHAFSSVGCIFTETFGKLPEAARALKAWSRFEVQGEGVACTLDTVGAIAGWLRKSALDKSRTAADIALASADLYLRQSDWAQLNHEDVFAHSEHGVVVLLGVPERGESTKTGTRQGVRADRDGVAQILLKYKARTSPGKRLFDISIKEFGVLWRKALAALKFDAGPPHTLRHVGPSHDTLTNYRTIDEVRTRGRWRAKTSVLRYSKSHALIAAAAAVPIHITEQGQRVISRLGSRPEKARN